MDNTKDNGYYLAKMKADISFIIVLDESAVLLYNYL